MKVEAVREKDQEEVVITPGDVVLTIRIPGKEFEYYQGLCQSRRDNAVREWCDRLDEEVQKAISKLVEY